MGHGRAILTWVEAAHSFVLPRRNAGQRLNPVHMSWGTMRQMQKGHVVLNLKLSAQLSIKIMLLYRTVMERHRCMITSALMLWCMIEPMQSHICINFAVRYV